jgi:uncharacterized caspase-like protein
MHRTALVLPVLAAGLLAVLLGDAGHAQSPRKYAVVVGVNEYQHPKLPSLSYAVNDAEALGVLLKAQGYSVSLLTDSAGVASRDKAPSKANIEAAIKKTLSGCQKGDLVIVALAGHGLQFDDMGECYFCPSDARPLPETADSLVPLSLVYGQMDASFAGMKVLLVDACRNDPSALRGARSGISADSAPRPPQGVAALFSCRAGERAFEHEQLRHGVFFYHVLRGLEGAAKDSRGRVTFAGLASYVSQEVSETVPQLVGSGAKQSPNLKADYSTEPVLLTLGTGRRRIGLPCPRRSRRRSWSASRSCSWRENAGKASTRWTRR